MRTPSTWLAASLVVLAACGGDRAPEETADPSTAPAGAAAAETAEPQTADLSAVTLPEGVTMEMVQAGRELYPNQVCTACHGRDGHGVENIGPDLLDGEWLNTDGSYEAIVRTIAEGVARPQQFPGLMMPKGGNPALTDAEVRQLAAYILATSRAPRS